MVVVEGKEGEHSEQGTDTTCNIIYYMIQ
jgi:hypothetical protein